MESFKPYLAKVATGASLTRDEARAAFDALLSGQVTPAQSGGFLMALRVRGETVDEIVGAITAMRSKMLPVKAPEGSVDVVGTGGDHAGSYNISTLAAIIVAACGVPVAKHGNRAASSKSGSADVLAALGIALGLSPQGLERCLKEANLCFMFAQAHHASMRHVAAARVELGTRTLFNLLGPLSNPARVKHSLIGVSSEIWMEPLAQVLNSLGSKSVWVVHGSDGLDEMTTTGPTHIVALENGALRRFSVTPEELGLQTATLADLKGGDPEYNARALRDVLDGAKTPYRDVGVLNAGGTLVVAGKAQNLKEGVTMAQAVLDDGRAKATLEKLITVSNAAS